MTKEEKKMILDRVSKVSTKEVAAQIYWSLCKAEKKRKSGIITLSKIVK